MQRQLLLLLAVCAAAELKMQHRFKIHSSRHENVPLLDHGGSASNSVVSGAHQRPRRATECQIEGCSFGYINSSMSDPISIECFAAFMRLDQIATDDTCGELDAAVRNRGLNLKLTMATSCE